MFSEFISPDAPYVKILGAEHLTYLIFCFIVITVFIVKRDFVIKNQNKFRFVFLGLLLFQQVFLLYGWYFFATPNFITEGLPLQLCRVASALTIVYLISGSKKVLDPLCYFSIYALISFFYPLHVYNFAHISGVSYMINHLITVLIPIFAFLTSGWFFSWKGYKRTFVAFTIYFVIVIIFNALTGSNYFYQNDRPFWHNLPSAMFAALTFGITMGAYAVITFVTVLIKTAVEKRLSSNKQKVYTP